LTRKPLLNLKMLFRLKEGRFETGKKSNLPE